MFVKKDDIIINLDDFFNNLINMISITNLLSINWRDFQKNDSKFVDYLENLIITLEKNDEIDKMEEKNTQDINKEIHNNYFYQKSIEHDSQIKQGINYHQPTLKLAKTLTKRK